MCGPRTVGDPVTSQDVVRRKGCPRFGQLEEGGYNEEADRCGGRLYARSVQLERRPSAADPEHAPQHPPSMQDDLPRFGESRALLRYLKSVKAGDRGQV